MPLLKKASSRTNFYTVLVKLIESVICIAINAPRLLVSINHDTTCYNYCECSLNNNKFPPFPILIVLRAY